MGPQTCSRLVASSCTQCSLSYERVSKLAAIELLPVVHQCSMDTCPSESKDSSVLKHRWRQLNNQNQNLQGAPESFVSSCRSSRSCARKCVRMKPVTPACCSSGEVLCSSGDPLKISSGTDPLVSDFNGGISKAV